MSIINRVRDQVMRAYDSLSEAENAVIVYEMDSMERLPGDLRWDLTSAKSDLNTLLRKIDATPAPTGVAQS